MKNVLRFTLLVLVFSSLLVAQQKPSLNINLVGSITLNQPFWVEVKVGDPNPVSDLYGISFKMRSKSAATKYVDGSAAVGPFLGSSAIPPFFRMADSQTVDIAITRSTSPGMSGSGVLVKAQFITRSVSADTIILTEISANDQFGNPIVFKDSILIVQVLPILPPQLLQPVNGAENQSSSISFEWNASLGAESYHLQVSMDSNFTILVVNDSSLTTTIKPFIATSYLKRYYWRIRAVSSMRTSIWSSWYSFTTSIGPAAVFSAVSGTDQLSINSHVLKLPLVIKVTDQSGNPIINKPINFSMKSHPTGATGFKIFTSSVNTADNGTASTEFMVGNKIGNYQIVASTSGLQDIVFNCTSTLGPAKRIEYLSGNGQIGSTGQKLALPFVATIEDTGGNPVPNISVNFSIKEFPSGSTGQQLHANFMLSNDSGKVSSYLTLGDKAGLYTVSLSSISLSGSPLLYNATAVSSNTPSKLSIVSGNNQKGIVNTSLPAPFVVLVTDSAGKPVKGVSVIFSINSVPNNSVGQNLTNTIAVTDSLGQASTSFKIGNKPNNYVIKAVSGNLSGSPKYFYVHATWPHVDNDLIVSNVNVLSYASGKLSYQYTIKNNGSQPTGEYFTCNVYLCDTTFTTYTYIAGWEHQYSIPAKGQAFTGTLNSDITMDDGIYYLNIEVDPEDIIFETDEANNNGYDIIHKIRTSVHNEQKIPTDFSLSQNYPNPFNPSTTLSYAIPSQCHVRIEIANLLGQVVAVLVDEEIAAGTHQMQLLSDKLSSGVYLYRIFAQSVSDPQSKFFDTKRMVLLK